MVLTYINPLNKNYKGEFIYEFIFSKDIDTVNFGEDWDVEPCSSGNVTPPDIDNIDLVGTLVSEDIELVLTIFSDHFSMYDCVENIVALAWEKDSPDDKERLVFHFGEHYESVMSKLEQRDKIIKTKKIINDE